jgi:hypothetical protein
MKQPHQATVMLFAIPELHELSADHGRANTNPIPLLESFAQPANPMLKIRDYQELSA